MTRKARCQLLITAVVLIERFSPGWGTMSRYLSKSLYSKGGGSLWAQILGEWGVAHQRLLASEN